MNERMLKLYKKAYVPAIAIDPSNNLHYETTTFSAEKFAELIVLECADLNFRSTGHVTTDGEIAIGDMIRNHFGVEE